MAEIDDTPEKKGAGLFLALVGEPASLWETTVEYISEHAEPQDVFSNEQLESWAKARGFQLPEE